MDKNQIVKQIENFAPLHLAEEWDCSGWLVETDRHEVSKIMLCLTVTDDVISQAKSQNCDMIISHHPLFFVPFEYKNIDIYCAHTNLDRTNGGTTDTLIAKLGLEVCASDDFVRYVNFETSVYDFAKKLSEVSKNLRYVNNKNVQKIKKIAFCAGSGSEFISFAKDNGADAYVTGDLKFHTALDSEIVLYDLGHFESEIFVLRVFEELLRGQVEVVYAKESSPFRTIFCKE